MKIKLGTCLQFSQGFRKFLGLVNDTGTPANTRAASIEERIDPLPPGTPGLNATGELLEQTRSQASMTCEAWC